AGLPSVAPLSLSSLVQCSVSFRKNSAYSSGVEPTASAPATSISSASFGSFSALTSSALIFRTMAGGGLSGTCMPYQPPGEKPGTASETGGAPGRSPGGSAQQAPRARRLPGL